MPQIECSLPLGTRGDWWFEKARSFAVQSSHFASVEKRLSGLVWRCDTKCKGSSLLPSDFETHCMRAAISYLLNNMLSPILNNPYKTAHPAAEDALPSSKVSSSQPFVIASSMSSLESNSQSFETPFNIPKGQKSEGLISGESSGSGNRET
jgi:hypothetical protein